MAVKKSDTSSAQAKPSKKRVKPSKTSEAVVKEDSETAVSSASDVKVGEWISFKGFVMLPSRYYLVGCSRTKKQSYVKRVGDDLITRGVYLDWKPDKVLVVPEL